MLQSAVSTRSRPTVNKPVKATTKKPTKSPEQKADEEVKRLQLLLDTAKQQFAVENTKPLRERTQLAGIKARCISLSNELEAARHTRHDLIGRIFARDSEPRLAKATAARERIEADIASNQSAIAALMDRLKRLALSGKSSATEENELARQWGTRETRAKVLDLMHETILDEAAEAQLAADRFRQAHVFRPNAVENFTQVVFQHRVIRGRETQLLVGCGKVSLDESGRIAVPVGDPVTVDLLREGFTRVGEI